MVTRKISHFLHVAIADECPETAGQRSNAQLQRGREGGSAYGHGSGHKSMGQAHADACHWSHAERYECIAALTLFQKMAFQPFSNERHLCVFLGAIAAHDQTPAVSPATFTFHA